MQQNIINSRFISFNLKTKTNKKSFINAITSTDKSKELSEPRWLKRSPCTKNNGYKSFEDSDWNQAAINNVITHTNSEIAEHIRQYDHQSRVICKIHRDKEKVH